MNTICQHTNKTDNNAFELLKLKLAKSICGLSELMLRRKTRRTLASLPDYLLKDIGVTRAEAQHEATKPFWQK
ncbi:DUF1127 domain-containing protein [Agarivorans gilvus]|uniref:YjiS-like domain-containing protein n=1 Tax=Agarivorans gilvus TaxID=680279 RepID=A0ABQ1I363_9ALTE|nr:DUF1127 domain-containing protein [Agarivorans gilvus]GGB09835.1 hypothetical protein GCM10007414_24040 [Agarivorans gilvus]